MALPDFLVAHALVIGFWGYLPAPVRSEAARIADALERIMSIQEGQKTKTHPAGTATGNAPAPRGQLRLPPPDRSDAYCWKRGQQGHLSPYCTNTPLPLEEQQRTRNSDLLRRAGRDQAGNIDPPLSQTLGNRGKVPADVPILLLVAQRVHELPTSMPTMWPWQTGSQWRLRSWMRLK